MSKEKAEEKAKKPKIGRPQDNWDLEKLTDELYEWADKEDSLHLVQFTLSKKTYSTKLYEWRDDSPAFTEALKYARDTINNRIRQHLSDPNKYYHERLAMRDIKANDFLLKDIERDDMRFEMKLKAELDKPQSDTLSAIAGMASELAKAKAELEKLKAKG